MTQKEEETFVRQALIDRGVTKPECASHIYKKYQTAESLLFGNLVFLGNQK